MSDKGDEPSTKHPFPLPTNGQRHELKTPRGVYLAKNEKPTPESNLWLAHISQAIHYRFHDPDLLEEALETPGSGVVCVGSSCRMCEDGNRGLARVGEGVLRLVVEDGCYLFKYTAKEVESTLKKLLHANTLDPIGRQTGIERFIRPKAPLRESEKKNPLKKMMAGGDRKKVVAQGVMAVIGAVYYDGGFAEARRVLAGLGLVPRVLGRRADEGDS